MCRVRLTGWVERHDQSDCSLQALTSVKISDAKATPASGLVGAYRDSNGSRGDRYLHPQSSWYAARLAPAMRKSTVAARPSAVLGVISP